MRRREKGSWKAGVVEHVVKNSALLSTPQAFANCSPGLEQPWVKTKERGTTLKALANSREVLVNAFSVEGKHWLIPGLSRTPTPGCN